MQSTEPEDRLEAIAQAIELLQRSALMQIADLLAKAHEIFRYRKDGGFGGWVEKRLNISRSTAYNMLKALEQFGDEFVQLLDRLAPTVLYALGAPSTPPEVRNLVIERVEAGEKVTVKLVKELKANSKQPTVQQRPVMLTRELQKEERHDRRWLMRDIKEAPAIQAVGDQPLPPPRVIEPLPPPDLHTALVTLISESKRLVRWINGIPPDVTYAKADLDAVTDRLKALDKDLVKRRKAKPCNRVGASAR